MVKAHLAQYTYGDLESNRPTGIVRGIGGDDNPYADNYERAFVTRG
jgi:hypothetical protein